MPKLNPSLCAAILLAAVFMLFARTSPQEEKAGPQPDELVLWTDPGDPSKLDLRYGVGGSERQPQPPFRFLNEDMSGTSVKVNVMDGNGRTWNVKWGHEARASAFCTRLAWACGYVAEPEYFVDTGQIEGARKLQRAATHISAKGSFKNGRFQLRSDTPKYLDGQTWSWIKNPFLGTREFQGLKILMLLVSNWDSKDARDATNHMRSSTNLAIFEDISGVRKRYLYADDDWGASMGKTGGSFTGTKWECKDFADETKNFVKRNDDGSLKWGFNGKHSDDLTSDINVSDLQWLLQYLGRITDEQLRTGLTASGATPEETECFTRALRQRIDAMESLAGVSAGNR